MERKLSSLKPTKDCTRAELIEKRDKLLRTEARNARDIGIELALGNKKKVNAIKVENRIIDSMIARINRLLDGDKERHLP